MAAVTPTIAGVAGRTATAPDRSVSVVVALNSRVARLRGAVDRQREAAVLGAVAGQAVRTRTAVNASVRLLAAFDAVVARVRGAAGGDRVARAAGLRVDAGVVTRARARVAWKRVTDVRTCYTVDNYIIASIDSMVK